jgi:hypothetical protein
MQSAVEIKPEGIAMRKTIIFAVAISSVLLGAVVVAAEPDAVEATSTTKVGSKKSNVDEKSSSGSYYPNSAGTVGDDPADPKSTAVSADTSTDAKGPKDQWGKLDSDGNGKVTESECRAWYESEKKTDSAPSSSKPSDKTGS